MAEVTVTDIKGLINLSKMSESDVREYLLNTEERQYPSWLTIDEENADINRVVYGLLKEKQRKVFDQIHSWLNNRNSEGRGGDSISDVNTMARLLDAPSGTGKTWLLMSLLITMKRRDILFLVYQRNLMHMAKSITNITAYTCARSIIEFCNVPITESGKYFDPDSLLDNFRKIIRTQIDLRFKFIVLDEYTVVSPWYLLLVYWIAKQNNACVLYCGDRYSLHSMNKTCYHDGGNYAIVEALASGHVFFDLDQERIQDEEYKNKVNEFKGMLSTSYSNLDMTEDMKSKLRELFGSHFSMESDMSATYVGQYHEDLCRRAREICDYYKNMGIECYRSPYYLRVNDANASTPGMQMNIEPNDKFLEFLPLIKDYVYYHVNPEGKRCLVKYLKRRKNGTVIVEDIKTGSKKELRLQPISRDYYVNEEYEYLKCCTKYNSVPYQYPLRLRLRTYHSIQGHSVLEEEKIELNIDTKVGNCVYVGLSHIRNGSQLGCLHNIHTTTYKERYNKPVEEGDKSPLVKLAMYLRDANCSELQNLVRNRDRDLLEKDINRYLISKGETAL